MEEERERPGVIELIDDYVLIVDRLSWSLARQKGVDKHGKPVYKYYGYFGSAEKALTQLGRELVYDRLKNGRSTFATLLNHIAESNTRLENFIKDAFPDYEVRKKGE